MCFFSTTRACARVQGGRAALGLARPPPIVMLPARLGRRKGGNMRFFDDRDDTPEQIIGDVLGLVVYIAIMALILDAVIPH